MNPSRLFIERPIATSLMMLAILLAGLLAYRLLPIAALPEVDYPTIEVTTLYPGASRCDDLVGDSPPGAPVWADAGIGANVVDQLRRGIGHHPAF